MKKKVVNINEAFINEIVAESLRKTILEMIRENKKKTMINECGYHHTGCGGGGCGGGYGYDTGCGGGHSYYTGCGGGGCGSYSHSHC